MSTYRNFTVLMVSMILMFSTAPLITLTASLIGKKLALNPNYSTLPIAMMIIGVVLGTIPAGKIFVRFGYKIGFILAAFWAICGALIACYAIVAEIFSAFCLGCFMMGNNLAFSQQSRFACLVGIPEEKKNIAVSVYLSGGIIAGLMGPQLASLTKDLFQDFEFAGAYLFQAVSYCIGILVLMLYKSPSVKTKNKQNIEQPLFRILLSPYFFYPMLCGTIAYASMSFIMTATPLGMIKYHNFDFIDATRVIQLHLMAMFVPSLFTGFIINRFGYTNVMIAGIILLGLSIVTSQLGVDYLHFSVSLFFLGVGWNFMFITSTSILVKFNEPQKLIPLQSKNDFFIFLGQASGALFSGTILHRLGWFNLNLITLPFILFALVLSLIFIKKFKKT